METERKERGSEFFQPVILEPPLVESFLDSTRAAEVWPKKIASNEIFREQIADRKEVRECFNNLVDHLPQPDVTIEEAISQEQISEQQAARLYDSLSKLLDSDQGYQRLILYFPFELLPDKSWQPAAKSLEQSAGRFCQSYLKAWKSLLSMHDVRANFVDGDVLEEEQRVADLPRVVKAAHLLPALAEKGLLEVAEAIRLMEESDDPILKSSIADTLPVLADLGLLGKKEIDLLKGSPDRLVSNMGRIIGASGRQKNKILAAPEEKPIIEPTVIQAKLAEEFSEIDKADYGAITEKRKKWLQQKKKQEIIETWGEKVAVAVVRDNLDAEAVAGFFAPESNIASQQVLIEGIRSAIESLLPVEVQKAREIFARHSDTLFLLWEKDDPGIREMLAKTFRRLRQSDIVDDRQLAELNIEIPKLAGPFSENLQPMKGELENIRKIVKEIEKSPELSRLLYPVVLIYGSRLKGYGERNADIDAGVFIKPGIADSELKELKIQLKKLFATANIHDEVVQFWLEEDGNQLKVRDFDQSDKSLGEDYWAHVLFGAAWEGDKKTMRQLRKKLLVPYFYDQDKVTGGMDARTLYLTEIERDVLQYRLMHNGYERFFPPCGGIRTAHADAIDGQSMFWDSGYRQLATKLFLSRIFLPQLPASEK